MNRQNTCVAAILAMALVGWGQEPNEDRVETKVIGPVAGVVQSEPIEIELEDLDLGDAVGSLILGVEGQPQDADEKGEVKARKLRKQDADKEGTIVREIDLGDGKTLRIVITSKKSAPMTKTWVGTAPEGFGVMKGGDAHVFRVPGLSGKVAGPEGMMKSLKVFGEGMHDFQFGDLGGDVKENLERALRAFDRAREEFIRAYKEGDGAPKMKRSAPEKTERRFKIANPHEGRVIIGKGDEEKAEVEEKAEAAKEAHEKAVEKIKAQMEDELAAAVKKAQVEQKITAKNLDEQVSKMKDEVKAKRGAVQWIDTAPGASTKGEIESLRREIKELEKMVRDLKDQLEKK